MASGLTVFLIVGAGFLFHRARKNAKAAEEVEYPGTYSQGLLTGPEYSMLLVFLIPYGRLGGIKYYPAAQGLRVKGPTASAHF